MRASCVTRFDMSPVPFLSVLPHNQRKNRRHEASQQALDQTIKQVATYQPPGKEKPERKPQKPCPHR